MAWNAPMGPGQEKEAAKGQDIFVMYWYPDYADSYSWFVNVYQLGRTRRVQPVLLKNDTEVDQAIDALPGS